MWWAVTRSGSRGNNIRSGEPHWIGHRKRGERAKNNRFLLSNNKALFPPPSSILLARSEGDLSEEERRLPAYHIRINTQLEGDRQKGHLRGKGLKGRRIDMIFQSTWYQTQRVGKNKRDRRNESSGELSPCTIHDQNKTLLERLDGRGVGRLGRLRLALAARRS